MTAQAEEHFPILSRSEPRATASACRLRNILDFFSNRRAQPQQKQEKISKRLPTISASRLKDAKDEENAKTKTKTKLYLAYGSNLCHETFQGKRGIKPLAALNVVVPTLRMTFDLPGIPYVEPCFANSALRDTSVLPPAAYAKSEVEYGRQEYNKDKWKKGMVGVVYEVTPSDYAHIIATEGGGASYKDVLVDCHPLVEGEDTVPEFPSNEAFKAHTLFAPMVPPNDPDHQPSDDDNDRFSRPDPSYAQPSARYLKLITDGAHEHALPLEYATYLHNIRSYEARGVKTRMGAFIFQMLWLPFMLMLFELMRESADEKGQVPGWVARLGAAIFRAVWGSYDGFFRGVFGDGERTDYSKKREGDGDVVGWRSVSEEKRLLARRYGDANGVVEKC